jgi:hypothetical protein
VCPRANLAIVTARKWPNLFLVGAAKAGTTSLYHHLARHPDVYMAPVKEPHFFSQIEPRPELAAFFPSIRDEDSYLKLFAAATDERLLGDASTSYLAYARAAERISAASPQAKIVIMLRNPVERAYSHYWNDVREGFEKRTFMEAIQEELETDTPEWGVSSVYVDCGFYSERVERYLRRFTDSTFILFFEEFVADAPRELQRLFQSLEIDPSAPSHDRPVNRNPFALPRNAMSRRLLGSGRARTVARRLAPRRVRSRVRDALLVPAQKPPMAAEARELLSKLYRPDVERLAEIVRRRPPWPRSELV